MVMIIGILVAIALPRYTKTMETSKANTAAATVQMVGKANKMFNMDHPGSWVHTTGATFTGRDCSGSCPARISTLAPGANEWDPCVLVQCGYLVNMNWNGMAYNFRPQDPTKNNCFAQSWRKNSATLNPGTGTDQTPYSGWQYRMNLRGGCDTNFTTAPPCPAI